MHGDVNIVELQGTVGSAPANDRKKGFAEIIATDPRYKIIRSQTGDFTRAKGKEVMEAFLKAEGKKINVLFAHNDDMAIGAIQAIEEAGLEPGKDITIISIDGVKGAFEAMIAGKLNVTVECSPLLGPQLMAAVKDVVAGKPIPKRIVTEESVFPKEVAASLLLLGLLAAQREVQGCAETGEQQHGQNHLAQLRRHGQAPFGGDFNRRRGIICGCPSRRPWTTCADMRCRARCSSPPPSSGRSRSSASSRPTRSAPRRAPRT